MSFHAGEKLGPYEITGPIGEGGMGEVYRAHDSRLGRDVAIKVSKEQFTERFEREARAVAALNHPNICALYDVGPNYLVMEFIEGESPRGPLPLEEVLRIARQIADALEAAHEKGIVHRDLKPANIKIKPDGTVKVLDFGLATLGAVAGTDPAESPTMLSTPTQPGMILGTAAYMAPEQARGKQVDKRADIWAFGVVLYELLSGDRPFRGDDVTEVLASVMKDQPDLGRVPASVQPLLRRCLEKDPKKRLRDIGDWQLLLSDAPAPSPTLQPVARFAYAGLAAVAIVVIVAVVLAFLYFRQTTPPQTMLRYTIAAPENATLHSFSISPNGRYLAIAAEIDGKRQLWLRALDSLQSQPLAGTEDAAFPFWSPDSRNIGFFAQGKLKKIVAAGGPAQSLCDAQGGGGSWNRDGVIVFSPGPNVATAIRRVSAAGGAPTEVVRRKGVHFPVFLPDGRHFLYLVSLESPEQNGAWIGSLDGKENRRILPDISSVVFASGRLLFIRDSTLMAQPLDPANGRSLGEPFPVAAGVSAVINNGYYAPVTVSDTGVLLYGAGGAAEGKNQIAWYDRGGKLLGAVGEPGLVFDPAISPDEKSVIFFRRQNSGILASDLWLRDLARGAEQRFTTDPSINMAPFWAPHGDRIVFGSDRGGRRFNLFQKAASGTGQDDLLLASDKPKSPFQWSRDGRFVVYGDAGGIGVLPMEGEAQGKPVPFLRSEFNMLFGQLSPDSRWMAYTSNESGQTEIYVRPFPAAQGQWKISLAGGTQPRWRADGKELFFVGTDGRMMSVTVTEQSAAGVAPSFEAGTPQPMFQTHLAKAPIATFEYDVTADGKRFLLDSIVRSVSPPLITAVVNWNAGSQK